MAYRRPETISLDRILSVSLSFKSPSYCLLLPHVCEVAHHRAVITFITRNYQEELKRKKIQLKKKKHTQSCWQTWAEVMLLHFNTAALSRGSNRLVEVGLKRVREDLGTGAL